MFLQVLICTGKVYYDLIKERRDKGLEDQIAIHTIEQICPFPFDMMKQVILSILYILPVTIKHDLAGG